MSKSIIYNLNGDLICQLQPSKNVITEQISCTGSLTIPITQPANPVAGNIYLDPNSLLYVYNGTGWVSTPGPTGATGTIGVDGATGASGAVGSTGATGATGPQGPTGSSGAIGATGPQGPTGASGAVGSTGATGPQGPIGATGSGISNSVIQTTINITGTISGPTFSSKSIEQVSYRLIGDKYRVSYRLGWGSGTSGSGQYLVQLPTGLSFNTSIGYNQNYTGTIWGTSPYTISPFASYFIPAIGGIVQTTQWNGACYVMPYDSTRFRVVFDNNNTNSLNVWGSSWYITSTDSLFSIEFEIWT